MTNQILSAETKLLILKYGYKRVLGAIAHSQGATLEEVEKDIETVTAAKAKHPRAIAPKSLDDVISSTKIPDRSRNVILELGAKFESKIFLPTLREVTAFLHRYGGVDKKPKSRSGALGSVIDVLAKLSIDQLDDFLEETTNSGGRSDYFLLAHEIMGKSPR